jgi:hypothetical protein
MSREVIVARTEASGYTRWSELARYIAGEPMTDATHKGSSYRRTILLGVALLIVYVLSRGPVLAVVNATGRGQDIAWVVYTPLRWLCQAIPPLQGPLLWYERLWSG